MERLYTARFGGARNLSSRLGGQMGAFGGKISIGFGEGGFDEQQIGATDEIDDGLPIGGRIGSVCHIANFLAWEIVRAAAKGAERHQTERRRLSDLDHVIVRQAFDHRAFKLLQPRTDRKLELCQPALPDIHMDSFLQRKGKTGRPVLKDGRRYEERRLVMDDALGQSA